MGGKGLLTLEKVENCFPQSFSSIQLPSTRNNDKWSTHELKIASTKIEVGRRVCRLSKATPEVPSTLWSESPIVVPLCLGGIGCANSPGSTVWSQRVGCRCLLPRIQPLLQVFKLQSFH